MKNFKQLGINPPAKSFSGEKIKIGKILNRPIVVEDYKIKDSKYEGKGKCLHLQIKLDGQQRVVFTGANGLMETLEQIPKDDFPFETTIVEQNERFEFS